MSPILYRDVTAMISAGVIYGIVYTSPQLSREVPPHVAAIASLGLYVIQRSMNMWNQPIHKNNAINSALKSCIIRAVQCAALISTMSVLKTSVVWTLHTLVTENVGYARTIQACHSH